MATYELPYAEKHLPELFQEARNGEDVIIVRADGLACQLLSIANVKQREPEGESVGFALPSLEGALLPA